MTMRLAGITGMFDTDAMVKAELEPYKLKVQTKTQERDLLGFQQKQYRSVLKDMKDFYSKYISTSKSDSLMLGSNYKSIKFTSSNDTAVTATGNSTANIENYTVNVKQLAANATGTLKDSDVTPGTDQTIQIGTATPTTTIKFKTGANGLETVANYNKAVSDRKAALIGKTSLTTDEQQELNDLNNIVVDARYNTFDKGVVFTSDKSGTGGFKLNGVAKTDQALDAEIVNSNGNKYRISSTENTTYSNQVTVDGVTFNFADTTGAIDDGTGHLTGGTQVKLTASKDVTAIKDKIVSFVNDYNTLITNLNTKLTEKRDKTYMPLTDDQKKDMSADDQKLWNEKVNAGLLRKDNDIQRIVSEMKSSMRTLISDSGLKLETIGITPVKDYTTLNGTFMIDEDKLTKALENNMDGVKGLFLKDTNDSQNYESNGILTSLKSIFETEVTSSSAPLIKKVGLEGSISDETSLNLDKMKTQLDAMNTDLTTRENNLYSKYAKLESAMNSLQSQQTWLSQQFGS